jgi:hypothetical protein
VNTTDVEPIDARRTLVTIQEQLADVVAALMDADLVALDLETTGLDPRKDSVRLLSLATKDATYIVDYRSVDPVEIFGVLYTIHKRIYTHGHCPKMSHSQIVWETGFEVSPLLIVSQRGETKPARSKDSALLMASIQSTA